MYRSGHTYSDKKTPHKGSTHRMATFQSLPFEVHIMFAKLLNSKESLIYLQVCRVAFDAVYYVFAHRKQLDFISVWGPKNTIALPDTMILKVMHAHTRAEVITGFSVSSNFSSYDAVIWMGIGD